MNKSGTMSGKARISFAPEPSSSPGEHNTDNIDCSPPKYGLQTSHPGGTESRTLQPKAVSRIKNEDSGQAIRNERRNSTSENKAAESSGDEDDRIVQNTRRQATGDTMFSDSFEQTAPWDQKAILSLDGGGIRGYSALLILRDVMKAIISKEKSFPPGPEAESPPKSSFHPLSSSPMMIMDARAQAATDTSQWLPCHYFDYMAGTSTGGLIGIMLGRLSMSIEDCISAYKTLGAKVFGRSRWVHLKSPLFWPRDKYDHLALEKVVKDLTRQRVSTLSNFPGGQNFAFDENRCRTVAISYQQRKDDDDAESSGVELPYLFRTYKNLHISVDPKERATDRNPQDRGHDIPIWQVARATSAAPTYFKPINIDGRKYLDGGFGANNPCAEIYEEVRKMNNRAEKCVKVVVSIGTGKDKRTRRFRGTGLTGYWNYMSVAKKLASGTEETHANMLIRASEASFQYYRLNVEDGLGTMKLDEWHARGPMRERFGRFVGRLRCRRPPSKSDEKPEENIKRLERQNGHVVGIEKRTATVVNGQILSEEKLAVDRPSTSRPVQNSASAESSSNIPRWLQPKNYTLESIEKHTNAYLKRQEVKDWIEAIAVLLVEGRRLRARHDPQRWEKACFGAWYQCRINGCPRGEKEYALRKSLQKHLLDKHCDIFNIDDGQHLKKALDDCKIVVY